MHSRGAKSAHWVTMILGGPLTALNFLSWKTGDSSPVSSQFLPAPLFYK